MLLRKLLQRRSPASGQRRDAPPREQLPRDIHQANVKLRLNISLLVVFVQSKLIFSRLQRQGVTLARGNGQREQHGRETEVLRGRTAGV